MKLYLSLSEAEALLWAAEQMSDDLADNHKAVGRNAAQKNAPFRAIQKLREEINAQSREKK